MRAEKYGPPYEPKAATTNPDKPVYVVEFWRPLGPPRSPDSVPAHESSEWVLRDITDVTEVLAWAKENAGQDRTYTVHVASILENGRSDLIHLYGVDPTRHYFEDSEPFRLVTGPQPQWVRDTFLTSPRPAFPDPANPNQ
jgi:hypothetical protein